MNIPFSKVCTDEQEVEAVARVIRSGWLAAGEETAAFEKEFSEYIAPVGVDGPVYPHCIFTNSCTSALKIAYKWYDSVTLRESCPHCKRLYPAEIHYPENTFCATYSAADEMGLKPFSYDFFDDDGLGVSKDSRINVHYGSTKDDTPCLIEDSAHRIERNDPFVGKIRCYSFYATKNMTTGSGGMFVTNDRDIYEFARLQWKDGLSSSTHDRQTGKSWDYKVEAMAGGYDGNDIAAAMGRVQLRKLPEFTTKRNRIRDRYNDALGQTWGGNHLYPFMLRSVDEVGTFIAYMKNKGIATGYHYPGTGWKGVSLPIYPTLTEDEQQYIIDAIIDYRTADHY